MGNISFADWWDDGVGKPVDVGYDCAYAAWKYKEQQLDRQRQQLEDYALSNIQDRQELAAETNNKQEFERDWLACCDKLNDERRIHLELEETLVKKLEAAQAREKVLLEALNYCADNVPEFWTVPGVKAALNQPTDNAALQNLIVYERLDAVRSYQTMYEKLMLPDLLKTERERVAKHFESRSYLGSGHQLAVEIRALEELE